MEAHPSKGIKYLLVGEKPMTSYFRFSGGTPRSSKILLPASFMAVTTGATFTREVGDVHVGHVLTNGNICLR